VNAPRHRAGALEVDGQLTLDSVLTERVTERVTARAEDIAGCEGCKSRDPARHPACEVCGADYDPVTGTGIPF
jgi:hypothetical protein